MKLKDEIIALLPTQISRWILGATLILPPLTYAFCPDLFSLFPKLSESNKLLIRLLLTESVALFGLLCLVASLIYYNHKRPNIKLALEEADERMKNYFPTENYFAKFGVLWDENKEPYCPACKTLLSQSVSDFAKNVQLECIKCEESLSLVDNGKEISLEEARALLNKT